MASWAFNAESRFGELSSVLQREYIDQMFVYCAPADGELYQIRS